MAKYWPEFGAGNKNLVLFYRRIPLCSLFLNLAISLYKTDFKIFFYIIFYFRMYAPLVGTSLGVPGGKGSITVSQVLHHQAGLANAALEELQRDPFLACDAAYMTKLMAESTPENTVLTP